MNLHPTFIMICKQLPRDKNLCYLKITIVLRTWWTWCPPLYSLWRAAVNSSRSFQIRQDLENQDQTQVDAQTLLLAALISRSTSLPAPQLWQNFHAILEQEVNRNGKEYFYKINRCKKYYDQFLYECSVQYQLRIFFFTRRGAVSC